jgi:hypothetical protein
MAQPMNAVPRSRRGLAALAAAALLLAGCAASPDPQTQREAARRDALRAANRIRELMAAPPAPKVRTKIDVLCADLKLHQGPAVIAGLVEALRPGEDEFNAVLIDLLDEMGAADSVPVRHRVRAMTIRAAVKLIRAKARRAAEADPALHRIRRACRRNPRAMITGWLELLELESILVPAGGSRYNITPNVQGLALLGLLRSLRTADHERLLDRLRAGSVTAPPPMLSQWLIHLSGPRLRAGLRRWLASPEPARAAALIACDLLRLQQPQPGPPTADRLKAATAWAQALPDDTAWRPLVRTALRDLCAPKQPRAGSERAKRLNYVRRLLDAPMNVDPLEWLKRLPDDTRLARLERLAGIDFLVPPAQPAP